MRLLHNYICIIMRNDFEALFTSYTLIVREVVIEQT